MDETSANRASISYRASGRSFNCSGLRLSGAGRALIDPIRLTLVGIIGVVWLALGGLLAILNEAVRDMFTQPLDNPPSLGADGDAFI